MEVLPVTRAPALSCSGHFHSGRFGQFRLSNFHFLNLPNLSRHSSAPVRYRWPDVLFCSTGIRFESLVRDTDTRLRLFSILPLMKAYLRFFQHSWIMISSPPYDHSGLCGHRHDAIATVLHNDLNSSLCQSFAPDRILS